MKHISLFSGIGGDTLAAEWAGFTTVLFVENDTFCQKVLNKHWPDVPIIGDIKDATKEVMENAYQSVAQCSQGERARPSETESRRTHSKSSRRSVGRGNEDGGDERAINTSPPITLITGGFPCQPVSVAGKQRGKEDDRYLWPEMLRVIEEVRPTWVVAENVAGLIRMGLDDCISDLEDIGYTTEPYLIPACAVNAPHRRDRIFIVANNGNLGQLVRGLQQGNSDKINREWESGRENAVISNNNSTGRWWAVEPDVGRVAYGVPARVDRLKALGNAIVPQQIYPILKAIADMENRERRL